MTQFSTPCYNETGLWLTTLPYMDPDHLRYPDLLELLEVPDQQSGTLSIKKEYERITIEARDRMLRHGRWKLVHQPLRSGQNLMLFDLIDDPHCSRNSAAEQPEIAMEMLARLKRMLDRERLPTASHLKQAEPHSGESELESRR